MARLSRRLFAGGEEPRLNEVFWTAQPPPRELGAGLDAVGFSAGFAVSFCRRAGGRVADAERFAAVIEALTGRGSKVCQKGNSRMMMERHREHLDGFKRYADAIVRRLGG
jgi:hypothetical protein